MRKIWTILFALLLALSLVACGSGGSLIVPTTTEMPTEPTTAPTEPTEPTTETQPVETVSQMEDIQAKLEQDHTLCAVAFVGYNGGSFAEIQEGFVTDGLLDALPVLAEVKEEHLICLDGSELYLVVPRKDVYMAVCEQSMDPESGETIVGEILYENEQWAPILLRGNVSDIFPNLVLQIAGEGGETMEYSPCLSLEDGMLSVQTSLICDMTPYELLGIYNGPDSEGDSFTGRWFAEAPNVAGETMLLELNLSYDGTASYGYGPADSELYEFFEGEWYTDEQFRLCLSLYGGAVGDPESQYSFEGRFQTDCEQHHLTLTHVDGYSLIYGLEGGVLQFNASAPNALIGLWTTSVYDSQGETYVYHDLELMGENRCNLLIHNGEGSTYAAYEGRWEFSDGNVTLDLTMFSGNNYQASVEQTIEGVYQAVVDTDGWMILYHLDGAALTDFMSECGYEVYEPMVAYG